VNNRPLCALDLPTAKQGVENHTVCAQKMTTNLYPLKDVPFFAVCTSEIPRGTITRNNGTYEGWNFNSGNYLFTTDTKL